MRITRLIAVAGVSMVALSGTSAWAQAAEEGGYSSDDIIVEARRKDESLQDVPLTVNAVTSESLAKLNIRDMKDITGVVPGLVLNSGNRTTGSLVSLRGLNVDNTSSGNNGTVEFYQNDAPISAGAVLQTMFDVGQIEVLRGPQGTLRGRAAPSGSITVTTKRPDMNEWGGVASATATGNGGINGQAAVNVPLVPGVLALRLAGVVDDSEGARVNSLNSQGFESNAKTRGVRVSLRAEPVEGLDLNASYTHLIKNSIVWDQVESTNLALGTPVVATLITAKDRLAVSNIPNRNHQAFDVFNWQAKFSFAGQRINYVGSVTKQDLQSTEPMDKGDFFGTAYPGDAALSNNNGTFQTAAATLNLQNVAQATHSYPKQQTHELRLSSEERLFGMADYIIGGFVSKLEPWTDLARFSTANFTGSVSPANFTGISTGTTLRRGRTLERSLFGNLTLHLGEKAEISGGTRYINYQENLNGTNNTFNAWIWSASAKYNVNEDLMVYANAGSSWRVGSGTNALILGSVGFNTTNVVDPYLSSLVPITPERSKSYEIGLRSTWLDRRLTVNISAFHQDFQNYIFPIAASTFYVVNNTGTTAAPVLTGAPINVRSAIAAPVPAKVTGIEGEVTFRPERNIMLSASVAYANARMSNAVIPCNPPGSSTPPTNAQIVTGPTTQVGQCTLSQKASRISPFTASLQSEVSQSINGNIDGFVRGLMSIYGKSTNDPQNIYDDVPAYALANLYLGVRDPDGAWEVTAYGKNLFNTLRVLERGSSGAAINTNLGARIADYRLISTTDPREFGISLRYAFGSR